MKPNFVLTSWTFQMKLKMKKSFFIVIIFALATLNLTAQNQVGTDEISGAKNPITVAVPFLTFAPDSRGSSMGDVGVATSPTINAIHWNNAKLAMMDKNMGVSFSYSPWLRNITGDMSLNYLSFFKSIDEAQAFGFSLRYFDLGEVQLTDTGGKKLNVDNPNEVAIDGTYSRKLSDNMSIGATFRFIWSNLVSQTTSPDAQAGTSLAVDIGWYYRKPIILSGKESELSFGAHISNVGQKITYSSDDQKRFIPGNLRLGSAYKIALDMNNSLTLALDLNKLLVPTPPIYEIDSISQNIKIDPITNKKIIKKGKDPNRSFLSGTFGSFTDAPGGFSEELKEFTLSTGAEYWYRDIFAARLGFFGEHAQKGGRKYMTVGAGFRYQVFGFDFSYLVPLGQNHPLADTIRLSILLDFNRKKGTDL